MPLKSTLSTAFKLARRDSIFDASNSLLLAIGSIFYCLKVKPRFSVFHTSFITFSP